MAIVRMNFYSEKLTDSTAFCAVIPVEENSLSSYPVLVLLPPMGGNFTEWMRHIDLDSLASEKRCMIVTPDIRLSCGLNMAYGLQFFDMLTEELPKVLKTYYPADVSRQVICGYQEGAYGAGYIGISRPEQYEKTVMISCGSLTEESAIRQDVRFENIFGPEKLNSGDLEEFELSHITEKSGNLPDIELVFGREDKYCSSAEAFSDYLKGKSKEEAEIRNGNVQWKDCYDILKKRIVFK